MVACSPAQEVAGTGTSYTREACQSLAALLGAGGREAGSWVLAALSCLFKIFHPSFLKWQLAAPRFCTPCPSRGAWASLRGRGGTRWLWWGPLILELFVTAAALNPSHPVWGWRVPSVQFWPSQLPRAAQGARPRASMGHIPASGPGILPSHAYTVCFLLPWHPCKTRTAPLLEDVMCPGLHRTHSWLCRIPGSQHLG